MVVGVVDGGVVRICTLGMHMRKRAQASPPHLPAPQTPMTEAMWVLECKSPVVVHLNFRSDAHLAATMASRGREGWLSTDGWERNTERESTVSTGVPNGPYSGPVFSKAYGAGSTVRLMGSNTWEGVYFVFVETQA